MPTARRLPKGRAGLDSVSLRGMRSSPPSKLSARSAGSRSGVALRALSLVVLAVLAGPVGPGRTALAQPFAAVVGVLRPSGGHCTGVLLAPRAVLTARHCLPAAQVVVGTDLRVPRESSVVVGSLTPPMAEIDVALLLLERPLSPAPHPRRRGERRPPPIGPVRTVGFGARDRRGRAGGGRLHWGELQAAGWGCDRRRARLLGCDPATEMVLRSADGADTCDGDSGGPVFEPVRGAPPGPRRWRLLGITSRPVADARVRCGHGGVYVRVDRVTGWLDAALATPEEP